MDEFTTWHGTSYSFKILLNSSKFFEIQFEFLKIPLNSF